MPRPRRLRWPDLDGWLRLALWVCWLSCLGVVLTILRANGLL